MTEHPDDDRISELLDDEVRRHRPTTSVGFDAVTDRVQQRRRRRVLAVSTGALGVILAVTSVVALSRPEPERSGTVTDQPSTSATPTSPASTADSPDSRLTLPPVPKKYSMENPPQFHVLGATEQYALRPWTACLVNGCYDGAPGLSGALKNVGEVDLVEFGFDLPGWTFDVTFREPGDRCKRHITVPAVKTGERTFSIAPIGPAGDWEVDLFGRGEDGGDAITTFKWTTPVDGDPGPKPSGESSVLADLDGEVSSYGVSLVLQNLDRDYPDATALITVTAANGRGVRLPLNKNPCYSEGSLYFDAPDSEGLKAAALGPAPFTYDAALILNGKTYHGVGVWPRDEVKDNEPNISLEWTPALPAYRVK